ncbi:MAG: hypothetical protein ABR551_12490, partial [Gemmatimonadales bacterium]
FVITFCFFVILTVVVCINGTSTSWKQCILFVLLVLLLVVHIVEDEAVILEVFVVIEFLAQLHLLQGRFPSRHLILCLSS